MWKTVILAAALALAGPAQAQTKKELVQQVLKLQRPGIEGAARALAEQPAALMMQRAGLVLQNNVPADKRDAVVKELQADARKYADEAVPILTEQAIKLAPTTIGPILEKEFSEAELKELIKILESPVNRKFQSLGNDMQRALAEKLVAEGRGSIEPKLRALEQTMAQRLNAAPRSGAASAPSAGSAASAPKR